MTMMQALKDKKGKTIWWERMRVTGGSSVRLVKHGLSCESAFERSLEEQHHWLHVSLKRKLQAWPPGRTYSLRRGRNGAGVQEMHTPKKRKGWDMMTGNAHTKKEEEVGHGLCRDPFRPVLWTYFFRNLSLQYFEQSF